MRIKKLALLLCISVLSACSMSYPKSLMQQPKRMIKNSKEIDSIKMFLREGRTFTLPISQVSGSIIDVDLDKDKTDEKIVLYKEGKDEYGVFFLKKIKNKFYKLYQIQQQAQGIDQVITEDLTKDNQPEIIVGWKNYSDQQLKIYTYHGGYFHELLSSKYEASFEADIDQDGVGEIVILDRDVNGQRFLRIFKYQKEKMEKLDEVKIWNPSGKVRMKKQVLKNGYEGIRIYFKEPYEVTTQDFMVKNGKILLK